MDGTTIRVTKALHNLGTEKLATRAGVSRITVWRWQTGRPHVAPETARKLEQALFSNGTADAPQQKIGAA